MIVNMVDLRIVNDSKLRLAIDWLMIINVVGHAYYIDLMMHRL